MAAILLRLGFQTFLLSCSIYAFARAANITKSPSCPAECSGNNVSIPYPFGIGDGCYISKWFEIVCNETDTFNWKSKIPVLRQFNLEVLEILLDNGQVRVNYPVFTSCTNNANITFKVELAGSPFVFSSDDNSFVAMGCNNSAVMWSEDEKVSTGAVCQSPCDHQRRSSRNGKSCKDTDCCVTSIPSDVHSFTSKIEPRDHSEEVVGESCRYAFLVENSWLGEKFKIPTPNAYFPVVLDWGIDNPSKTLLPNIDPSVTNDLTSVPLICQRGDYPSFNRGSTYSCRCNTGFHGNPYLPNGCQDIDECANSDYNYCGETRCENTLGSYKCIPARRSARLAIIIGISTSLGLVVMLIGGWWSYKAVNKRKMIKQKEKFFKRNGGLLLQQQLSSNEINVQTTKLFDSKELEKATDRFNVNRMLGQGGQGTVYKGMLLDGSIVAIKKSKIIDERKLEEFINEVVILSHINHRNVVKLLGCCLETEVPLLVYEFIPNGTLFQYLNNQNEEFPPTWDMRLQIATDIAGALFYLHSAASSPIYHRDIKSTNILLDEKYRAKLADFGTSRSVAIDQTHLTTQVQGTFGYLDPEYFQTSQFTEKSDVYSFGVVLVELLTGEKAISSIRTEDTKGLASYFIRSMEENNLFDILDDRVLKEGEKEVVVVANLAKRCLNLRGKKRPTMKEISMELVAVQTSRKVTSNLDQEKYEEVEYMRTEMYEQWARSTSTTLTSCVDSSEQHLLAISS